MTGLLSPPGALVDDERQTEVEIHDRIYTVQYGGVPVVIEHETVARSHLILNR